MSTEIAVIEIANPLQVFSTPKGLDAIIDKIEAEVKNIDSDISTEKGRDNIRSIAFKLAKSKTALDKMGLDLTETQRLQIAAVNVERKRAWERMETLQAEIRKPLTDWENTEKLRVSERELALSEMIGLTLQFNNTADDTVENIEKRINRLQEIGKSLDWHEFTQRAQDTHKSSYDALRAMLDRRIKIDAEQAELDRLRKEDAERKQKEHEDRIAKEAADKARIDAEAKAKAEAEALAAKVKAEQDKAEQEKQRIIKDKEDAEAKAKEAETKAEMEKIAAEGREKAAKIQAEKDAEASAQRERDKIAAEKKTEADALAKREADKNHRKKINNEAKAAILKVGAILDAEERSEAIIAAIAKGAIPHVKIEY